ncbi:hypothetical protein [Sphingomonas sp. GB1N7]
MSGVPNIVVPAQAGTAGMPGDWLATNAAAPACAGVTGDVS